MLITAAHLLALHECAAGLDFLAVQKQLKSKPE
jgi:hypothetical protein